MIVKKSLLYLLFFISIFPLFSCQKTINKNVIDNNSYINDFELTQQNPINDNLIIINSKKAIIDQAKNDIEIFKSTIKITNKNEKDIIINSGNSILNNSDNIIKVYNNVFISLLDHKETFIKTKAFDWDLNTSLIKLNNPLDIKFENTIIKSSNGTYNIESRLLKINNNIFNRMVYNSIGDSKYNIEIISDTAKWFDNKNILEFKSNNKQVETTINFF